MELASFVLAPQEHVLRPWLATSLFPGLPRRLRPSFRWSLVILALAVVACALLSWQAPMVAIGALGLPGVFVLYLREARFSRGVPLRAVVAVAVPAIGFGIAWALFSGRLVADSADVGLRSGTPPSVLYVEGPMISAAGALLMLVPILVLRLWRPAAREPLGGFVIGASAALGFTAAGTVTRLVPQLMTGPTAGDRPVGGLVVQGLVQGLAVPVTTAAIGGLVGAALWFTRRAGASETPAAAGAVASIIATAVFFGALGYLERLPLLQALHLVLHVVVAAVAVLALRIVLQVSVDDGAHDPADVADAEPVRTSGYTRVLAPLGAGLVVLSAGAVALSVAVTPIPPQYVCPPDCGEPPLRKPVEINPRFVARDGSFSVSYPAAGSAYRVTFSPEGDGVTLDFTVSDTGTLDLWGEPAANRTPKQIAEDMIGQYYPDAETEYEIPNAMVGYEPGYGVVADDYPMESTGRYTRLRLVVMVAVKNDVALIASAIGPYHEFSPGFGTGHPSAANLEIAMDMGKYVNSFTWSDRS